MTLRVKVIPNARKSQIVAWEDHPDFGRCLRIQLAAPPVDGKANQALIRFLSKELRIPKSQITLSKGHASRIKTLTLPEGAELPA